MNKIRVLVVVNSWNDVQEFTKKNAPMVRDLTWNSIGQLESNRVSIQFIAKEIFECGFRGQSVDIVLNMSDLATKDLLPIAGPALMSGQMFRTEVE